MIWGKSSISSGPQFPHLLKETLVTVASQGLLIAIVGDPLDGGEGGQQKLSLRWFLTPSPEAAGAATGLAFQDRAVLAPSTVTDPGGVHATRTASSP